MINKFNEFTLQEEIVNHFINSLDPINENRLTDWLKNNWNEIKKTIKKIYSDLKFNIELILTFGTGIGALLPIVEKIVNNEVQIDNQRTLVLLTVCALTIAYIEEKKFKNSSEEEILIKDSKSMLEELRMNGIGDGIVKKILSVIQSIKEVFKIIVKHTGSVIRGIVDMFSYSSLLIPFMNAFMSLIDKYNFTSDTISQNMKLLGVGVGTVIAKNSIIFILNKMKKEIPEDKKEDIIDEFEELPIKKFHDFSDAKKDVDLIKED
jgi:hypothetical protein